MNRYERADLDKFAANLRDGSPGYHQAKAEYEGMREVKCYDLIPNVIDTAKPRNVLARTAHYVRKVNWVVQQVVAQFYTGKPRDVYTPDDLKKVLWEGKVRDLASFAAMTGLYERHVSPSDGQRLLSFFSMQCLRAV
ncbi:unnamed protein product [Arabis nemorensis]|uniref:Uncharacterized protein n=1 Tax=Arabis nemorensis TaxID=586526 RepID=A0A565BY08_9BRAS|nr:unnamed protein product [Arabis nemorensis]